MLRLQAGVTLFMSARDCALTERRSVLERAAAVLRKALDDAAFSGQADVFTASGWVTLGRCYANLQRFDDARQAFDSAIGVIPDYPEALVERAFLYKGSDPARALRDFQAAIQAGSPFLTPYLHVAYDALQTGDFDQCRKLCHRILRMGPTRQVRAVVYHWVAICEYQERRSEQTAREYLRKALLIDPLNDAIRADNQRIAPSSADGSLIALDGLRPGSATRLPGASADTWRQLERAA
jgi:tetratricopeptide (TPR) repeat protein